MAVLHAFCAFTRLRQGRPPSGSGAPAGDARRAVRPCRAFILKSEVRFKSSAFLKIFKAPRRAGGPAVLW